MKDKFRILIVDDNQNIINSIIRTYDKSNYVFSKANDGETALRELSKNYVDLVILDIRLPDANGLELLESIKTIDKSITVIILTGFATIEDAVSATRKGAFDYIEKSNLGTLLPNKIRQVYSLWEQKLINRELRQKLENNGKHSRIIGNSTVMQEVRKTISSIGITESTVLIQGETGTGKELIASEIHRQSNRKKGPFVPVDCAAITDTTFESEFFGHCKGSYTGAVQATKGLFRAADKGTIFFDEIGELSLVMQAKLLRTIQEHEVRPVGGTSYIKTDFRLIAATNRNLENMVSAGTFRDDLFYRLNTIQITSPPLRDREDDSVLLFRHFLKKFSIDDEPGKIDPKVLIAVKNYSWPGNIRELQNTVQHIVALCQNDTITMGDLPGAVKKGDNCNDSGPSGKSFSNHEKKLISEALAVTGGNKRKAAEYLGIGEATVYRKIKKYGL